MVVRYAGRATGRVQGVGFRSFVRQQAMNQGFTGWVKNMPDGSVTMEVQGPEERFAAFGDRIKGGNEWIKVNRLDWESKPCQVEENDFVIRR